MPIAWAWVLRMHDDRAADTTAAAHRDYPEFNT